MTKVELEIKEAVMAFKAFSGVEGNATVDLSWAIDDIKDALEKHNKRYTEETKKLLQKYGTSVDGVRFSLKRENFSLYNSEMEVIDKIPVTIEIEQLDYDAVLMQEIRFDPAAAKVLRKFIKKTEAKEVRKETPAAGKTRKLKPAIVAPDAPKAAETAPAETV